MRFGPEEVWLQIALAQFDAATLEIWGALLNGGCLVLPPPGVPTLSELSAMLTRHGVTCIHLPAALFHAMVDEDVEGLSPVRQLASGGDALSPGHASQALATLPGTRLWNGYGPTECTTFTCCAVVEGPLGASVPVGRPIANTRVYVVDAAIGLVPAGVAGELWVGGDGLARGYLARPDLTADRFVPDPFGGDPGARLYRTGDRVRWLADGQLEFLGRIDRQVKIRGFRIEPGEVERALLEHESVAEAAVLVRETGGEKTLMAYATARSGATLTSSGLRSYLRERLPEYMVPGAFVILPSFPLTGSGKVDRGALGSIATDTWEHAGGGLAWRPRPRLGRGRRA
jgi:amino acid adenylation domain-containing protein